jgi:hypothetical protein
MKIIPAIIAIAFGICFLAMELRFEYYPPIPVISMSSFDSPEQARARAAVSALLIYPETASIDDMRTMKSDGGLYVCGEVNGKDRSGSYAGAREFVYEVAGDFAVIDHDDQITRSHRNFRPCPEDDSAKPKPFVVDLGKVNKVLKVLPKPDIRIANSVSSPGSHTVSGGAGGSQDLRQGIEGLRPNIQQNSPEQSDGASTQSRHSAAVTPGDEREWRGDQPPKSWPQFSPGDPLSKPEASFAQDEALELASDIERRWKRFESGRSSNRPSVPEVEEALRALMTIKEQNPHYPEAWASFVRLHKIRRDLVAQ